MDRRRKVIFSLIIISHVLLIWWLFTSFSWVIFVLGVLFFHTIGRIGNDIGFHRYYCHQSFTAPDWFQYVMLFCGTIFGAGSSIDWVAFHSNHHLRPNDIDPLRTNFTLYKNGTSIGKGNLKKVLRAKQDQKQVIFDKHYLPILITYLVILIELSITSESWGFLMICFVIPRLYAYYQGSIIDIVGHRWGYQTYDNGGSSRNNALLNILTIGNGMHNNHHANPWNYTQKGNKWYEFDLWGWIIGKFICK